VHVNLRIYIQSQEEEN